MGGRGSSFYAGGDPAVSQVMRDAHMGPKGAEATVEAMHTFIEDDFWELIEAQLAGERADGARQVERYIARAPKWDDRAPTYRAVEIESLDELAAYTEVGAILEPKTVQPWSSSFTQAEGFMINGSRGTHVVLRSLTQRRGVDVSAFVTDPSYQSDVLVGRGPKYVVRAVHRGTHYTMVDVEEIYEGDDQASLPGF